MSTLLRRNVSSLDRTLRAIVGLTLVIIGGVLEYKRYMSITGEEAPGFPLMVLGLAPLLTALVGFCPLYTLFKKGGCKCADEKSCECTEGQSCECSEVKPASDETPKS